MTAIEIQTPCGSVIQTEQGTISKINTPNGSVYQLPNNETVSVVNGISNQR